MSVGVETDSLLLPLTACGSSGYGVPRPPLRQVAGRYATYALLWWSIVSNFPKSSATQINILRKGFNKRIADVCNESLVYIYIRKTFQIF